VLIDDTLGLNKKLFFVNPVFKQFRRKNP